MRQHLGQDFSKLYLLNLGGNVRKNPKLSGTTHNVFGIQVGVSINLFVKKKETKNTDIFYASVGEDWRKEAKYSYLDGKQQVSQVEWQIIAPDKKHTWLTEGMHFEFDEFLPLGTKKAKWLKLDADGVIFKTYSLGINTNRDVWAYNFNSQALAENMQRTIEVYNKEVERWLRRENQSAKVDDFVLSDDTQISWSLSLKSHLKKGKKAIFSEEKIRSSLYRPFTRSHLFFDRVMNNAVFRIPSIFPTPSTDNENRVICVSGVGHDVFICLIANHIADLKY